MMDDLLVDTVVIRHHEKLFNCLGKIIMFLTRVITFLFLLLILFSSHAASAAFDPPTKEFFNSGVEAFGNGNYEKALVYFTAAQEAGLDSEALHYNLGVTYFKLSQYKKAKKEFQWLLKSSDAPALFHYNLGLISLRMQNESKAQSHFQSAYRLSEDSKLKKLAEIQLGKFEVKPEPPAWTGYFALGAGRDDNVTLDIEGSIVSNKMKDEFIDLIAFGAGQLSGNRENGVQLKVSSYGLKYLNADEYDFANLSLSPELDYQLGPWQTELSGNVGLLYLGGALYERLLGAGIKGTRPIIPKIRLVFRYRLNWINTGDNYDYLSGTRHQASIGFRSTLLNTYSSLKSFLELNNRNDDTYPTRYGIRINVKRDINEYWDAELIFAYRVSEYHGIPRSDKRLQSELKVRRKLPWEWKLYGKYIYTRNDSNDHQSEYVSNIIAFGVERFFY